MTPGRAVASLTAALCCQITVVAVKKSDVHLHFNFEDFGDKDGPVHIDLTGQKTSRKAVEYGKNYMDDSLDHNQPVKKCSKVIRLNQLTNQEYQCKTLKTSCHSYIEFILLISMTNYNAYKIGLL